ncbi:ATP-binding protein [Roseospira navarrensis]|uniref:histidine kinase n=1 Tax=Roseospira navarrensis TaxID=140058 RepID=A0A7X1ZGW9_9PROT|nr:ATP-binding protein [Roseospira navarrensis]MQX37396.1 response regulator [Roseospira navarrensis]
MSLDPQFDDPRAAVPGRVRRSRPVVLISGAVMMALIVGVVGYWTWNSYVQAMARAADVTQAFSIAYTAFTDRTLDTLDAMLTEVAAFHSGPATGADATSDHRLRERISHHDLVRDVLVTAADGTATLWTGAGPPPDLDRETGYRAHRDSGARHAWVSPVRPADAPAEGFVFTVIRTLRAEDGAVRGSIAAVIDQGAFAATYQTILQSVDASVTLLHADGTVMVRLPDPGNAIGRVIASATGRMPSGPRPDTLVADDTVDGMMRIISVHRVGTYPLMAAATVSRHAALAPWRRDVAWGVGIILVSAMAVIALTYALIRMEARQTDVRRALRRQNTLLTALQDTASDGILVASPDGRILTWNRRFADLWGLSDEVLALGRSALLREAVRDRLVDPEGFETRILHLYRHLDEDEREGVEVPLRDGRVLERYSRALRREDGTPWGRAWFYRDITQRRADERALRQAKQEAEEANMAKSRFLAVMSHEIRTPMTGVLGMADLLRASGLGPRQTIYAETLRRSADTLLSLLNDILDFSKIEAGQLDLDLADFDPRRIVEDVIQLFSGNASEKGLRLDAELTPAAPPLVRGDPYRLRQVLFNLASNAIKFTETGSVTLVMEPDRPGPDGGLILAFAVRDTGIGLSETQRRILFQPFIQADNTTTRRFGGTGLGLAICKRLVTLMGGDITVESAPGAGSTFRFWVPVAAGQGRGGVAPLAPAGADLAALTGPDSHLVRAAPGSRLLLAEDTVANRLLIATVLERMGFVVDEVADGRAALEAVAARPDAYALVIMDMQMPVMDGTEATRAIRALPGDPPPVIGLTADAVRENRARYMAAGLVDLLTKPVDWERLAGMVRACARGVTWLDPAPTAGRETPEGDAITGANDPAPAAGPRPDPAPAHRPLLDSETLEALVARLGPARLRPIVHAMLTSVSEQVGALARAAEAGDADPEAVGRIGHALKGLAGQFGAGPLADAGAALDADRPVGGDPSARLPTIQALADETQAAVVRWMRAALDRAS